MKKAHCKYYKTCVPFQEGIAECPKCVKFLYKPRPSPTGGKGGK